MEAVVRKARLSDVESIAALAVKLLGGHSVFDSEFYKLSNSAREDYEKHFRKSIRNKNWLLVVAEADERIMGYALAAIEGRPPIYALKKRCVLHDIFIEEEVRGKGLGRRLMQRVLDFAKAQKVRMMQVIVDVQNEKAIRVYKKIGFKEYDKTLAIKL